MRDYKDFVIEQQADDLHLMTERAIDAEADRDSYRLITRQLLTILHVAISDPEAWPRRARTYREQHKAMTGELIAELFTIEHLQESSAA
jgi:hypothetical protein